MLKTTPRPAPRPSAAVTQTLALLALSPQELLWRLSVEAAENPALHLRRPPPDPGRMQIRDAEGVAAGADGLIAHVLRQIDLMDFAAGDRAIAIVLTEALEPTGWLGTAPARIARACGQPEARVLAVLERLQWIEPGGLFARSLAECLRLQARQAGELGPQMEAVLADLPLLAAAGPAALAERTGLSQADVSAMFGLIRGYDPKPGLAFGNAGPVAPPADLLIAQEGQRWVARPNPLAVDLRVEAGHPGSRTAEALRQAVEGRLRIALAVGSVLAGRQAGWLAGGALLPLTSRDIAAETGFHVATVNRCLAMVSARTSRGIHPLRRLTSHPVGAGGASADALRASLAALLRQHGPDLPSDAALARALAQNGIPVARRTVTKYRLELQRGQAGIAAGDA